MGGEREEERGEMGREREWERKGRKRGDNDMSAKSVRVYVQMLEGVCEDNKPSTSLGVGGLFSNRAFGAFPVSVNIENRIRAITSRTRYD